MSADISTGSGKKLRRHSSSYCCCRHLPFVGTDDTRSAPGRLAEGRSLSDSRCRAVGWRAESSLSGACLRRICQMGDTGRATEDGACGSRSEGRERRRSVEGLGSLGVRSRGCRLCCQRGSLHRTMRRCRAAACCGRSQQRAYRQVLHLLGEGPGVHGSGAVFGLRTPVDIRFRNTGNDRK